MRKIPSKSYLKATRLAFWAWSFLNMDRASQTRCSSPRHGVEGEQRTKVLTTLLHSKQSKFLIVSLPLVKIKHEHNVPPAGMAMEREERTVFMVIS